MSLNGACTDINNSAELLRIPEVMAEKKAGLQSVEEPGADTTTPAGRMLLKMFAGGSAFERGLIKHCIDEGHEVAERRGVSLGRPRKLRPDQKTLVLALVAEGRSISEVARTFNVHPPLPEYGQSRQFGLMTARRPAQTHGPMFMQRPYSANIL